jgi:predicted  nucleic acid-binding Zn-ribbon protein
MGALLAALLELQDIEHQIVDLRRQLAGKERQVAAQATRLKALEEAIATEREALRRAQMEIDALDLDIRARTTSVNRLRESMNQVRTNKEYAAMLLQLNTEKAEASRIESRALELMGALDGRKAALLEREQIAQAESRKLAQLREQSEQAQRSLAERLQALAQRRENAAGALSREARELFNRVSERYEGEAMARVSRVHPRRDDFICEGCNMSVSAERANALMTRDEIISCRSCGRILYIEPRSSA